MSELLSVKAAAKRLCRRGRKLHISTIYRAVFSGHLPAERKRGVWYVRREDLDRVFPRLPQTATVKTEGFCARYSPCYLSVPDLAKGPDFYRGRVP